MRKQGCRRRIRRFGQRKRVARKAARARKYQHDRRSQREGVRITRELEEQYNAS